MHFSNKKEIELNPMKQQYNDNDNQMTSEWFYSHKLINDIVMETNTKI